MVHIQLMSYQQNKLYKAKKKDGICHPFLFDKYLIHNDKNNMSLPQNLKKILLTEGGAVFDGTIRIEHKYLESTYKSFCDNILSKCTNYKKYSTLGSYGQKASYGDIDIGVQCDDINDFVKVLTDVCTKAGYKVDFMKGLGVISVQYDIVSPNNRERIGKCQIDCMPIKDLSYASWSYSSPIKD